MNINNSNIIEHKINNLNARTCNDEYIVIIGASNSLMSQGWAYFFTKKIALYQVINLSLGATSSSYIALIFLIHRKLLDNAKYIIVEPFVNDVSFVGNKELTKAALLTCIDYYYNFDATISKKLIVLLLPTQKRIHGIFSNDIYKAHLYYAAQSNVTILDCHPYFESLDDIQIKSAFKDPAHLNCKFSELISNWIIKFIENWNDEDRTSNLKCKSKSRMFYVPPPSSTIRIRKSTSLFSCDIVELKDKLVVEVPFDHSLIGILHWSDMNENLFKISSCGQLAHGLLRSKYLKLTSLPFDVNGSFIIENESDHVYGIAGFLFSDNIITLDKDFDKKFLNSIHNDKMYFPLHL
ncbi:hypothetical protein [Aeromonas sp. MR16]|uniref:hypothetical protein n=1 Tax=Aeromonas sp. MR16 TaxID=2923420 RepID=UPI001F4AFAE1|nr:hypothetical protein [Aeromonas sp. MR16]MCH7372355.1 hypothetical protein [Aeromonas sp. MR16]